MKFPRRSKCFRIFGRLAIAAIVIAATVFLTNEGIVKRLTPTSSDESYVVAGLYVLVRAVTCIIAPISAAPLQAMCASVFGFWVALTLSAVGEAIGNSVNYCIGRFLSELNFFKKMDLRKKSAVNMLGKLVVDPSILLLARVFLAGVFDLCSYAAGFFGVRYVVFLLINTLGGLIPTGLFIWLFSNSHLSNHQAQLIAAMLIIVGVAATVLWERIGVKIYLRKL